MFIGNANILIGGQAIDHESTANGGGTGHGHEQGIGGRIGQPGALKRVTGTGFDKVGSSSSRSIRGECTTGGAEENKERTMNVSEC